MTTDIFCILYIYIHINISFLYHTYLMYKYFSSHFELGSAPDPVFFQSSRIRGKTFRILTTAAHSIFMVGITYRQGQSSNCLLGIIRFIRDVYSDALRKQRFYGVTDRSNSADAFAEGAFWTEP